MTSITSFKVSPARYFVQCNRDATRERFDAKLVFDIDFIPQEVNDTWVEKAFADIRACILANLPTQG